MNTYAFAACEAGCPNFAHVFLTLKVRIWDNFRTVRKYISYNVCSLRVSNLGGFVLVDCVEAFSPLLLFFVLVPLNMLKRPW